jgi:hypothetical protein
MDEKTEGKRRKIIHSVLYNKLEPTLNLSTSGSLLSVFPLYPSARHSVRGNVG